MSTRPNSPTPDGTPPMPATLSAASIADLRAFVEALAGNLMGELAEELLAKMEARFEKFDSRFTAWEGQANTRIVDSILSNSRTVDREKDELRYELNRARAFIQPEPGDRGEIGPQGERGERGLTGDPGQT